MMNKRDLIEIAEKIICETNNSGRNEKRLIHKEKSH